MHDDNDATVKGSGAIAQDGSSAAGPHGVSVGRDIRDSLIITGDSNKVTVILRGKNLRDEELLYLDDLLKAVCLLEGPLYSLGRDRRGAPYCDCWSPAQYARVLHAPRAHRLGTACQNLA